MNLKYLSLLVVAACASTPKAVRLSTDSPVLTLVWVGRGEAERLDATGWQRVPAFDYEFSVEQRRFADHWESVKHLTRSHPDYDGSAGPREQTMYFQLDYQRDGDGVRSSIRSTLGDGAGTSDSEFRHAHLKMRADVSSMAPFDTYQIEQTYSYEKGELREDVTLLKGEAPWVRNHEVATLFAPKRFDAPPTTLK